MSANSLPVELFNAPVGISDPGDAKTITIDRSPAVVPLDSTAAQTRTLAVPTAEGVLALLYHRADAGDITLTVTSGYNEDGDTAYTFSDPGQFLLLLSIRYGGAYYWRKVADYTTGNLTAAELGWLNGITAGTGAASKALVLDANGDVTMPDLGSIGFGGVGKISWDTSDANANEMLIQLPPGGATDVPVLIIGDTLEGDDLGLFDGTVSTIISIMGSTATATGPSLNLRKSRGTNSAPTVVTSGDDMGSIDFYGCVAANEYVRGARILAEMTGTVATTRGPGVLTFQTATDAAPSVLTSALTISAAQVVDVPVTLSIAGTALTATAAEINQHCDESANTEVVTTTNVIAATESGKTFYLNAVGGFTSTLPVPAAGLRFRFIVKTAPTTAYIITTNAGADILYGMMLERAGTAGVAGAARDTFNFVASQAIIGDWVEFYSDGTSWFYHGMVDVAAGNTVAAS